MSYLLEVDEINNSTRIENTDGSSLLLSRVVSKIAIVNAASNFDFTGITAIVNVPRQGQLHKSDDAVYNISGLTELRYDASYSSPLIATSAVSGGQSTADKPIYLYEITYYAPDSSKSDCHPRSPFYKNNYALHMYPE